MSCKIIYCASLPADIKADAKPLLTKYRFMLPAWLNTLAVIGWQNEGHADEVPYYTAEVSVKWEYRQATLLFYPKWRQAKAQYKDATIAHELTHLLLAPLDAWVGNIIDNAIDEDFAEFLREDYRKMCEGATEDISQIIHAREKL
jgi:hypothetical protein